MATIRDVATAAGVSVATVSAVINDSAYVSPELRGRVLNAISKLRYAPSQVARNLSRGRTQLIALAVADLANPFYARIVWAAEAAAAAWGYALVVFNSDENPDTENRVLDRIRTLGCDGSITRAGRGRRGLPAGQARAKARPSSCLAAPSTTPSIDTVTIDNRSAGRQATAYLIDLGHTRIGSITGPLQISTGKGRLEGMVEAMAARGLSPHPAHIRSGEFREEVAYSVARDLLSQPDRPSCALCCKWPHGAWRHARHRRSWPALPGGYLCCIDRQYRRHWRASAATYAHRASGSGNDQRSLPHACRSDQGCILRHRGAMLCSIQHWSSAIAALRCANRQPERKK